MSDCIIWGCVVCCAVAWAQPVSPLPETVAAALRTAGIDEQDVSVVVADVAPGGRVWLQHNEHEVRYPASVIKLVTTFAALDMLGANYTWNTAVFADGPVSNGVLQGSLYIRGSGDPFLSADRMRELLLQVNAAGVVQIQGDLLIDRSAYSIPDVDPAAFDGEPLRAYNVRPDAMLVNFKTISLTFNPSLAQAGERIPVIMSPPLAGVGVDATVAVGGQRNCGDWKAALQADFSDPLNIRFAGTFPQVCGPKQWYVAFPDPQSYSLRAIGGLWQELGGSVQGRIGFGSVPAGATLVATGDSKSLAEVVRDVNKFSNNVMAQSVFLALSLPEQKSIASPRPIAMPATLERSQQALAAWWHRRLPRATPPVMDNGSGLSRSESISASSLAAMLQLAWESSVMPEYISSLPIAGVDGTMRRSNARADAHIKTGSIRNVVARAGYVLSHNGQRRVLVFLVNSNHADKAKDALDALIDWAAGLR